MNLAPPMDAAVYCRILWPSRVLAESWYIEIIKEQNYWEKQRSRKVDYVKISKIHYQFVAPKMLNNFLVKKLLSLISFE